MSMCLLMCIILLLTMVVQFIVYQYPGTNNDIRKVGKGDGEEQRVVNKYIIVIIIEHIAMRRRSLKHALWMEIWST